MLVHCILPRLLHLCAAALSPDGHHGDTATKSQGDPAVQETEEDNWTVRVVKI